MSEEAWELSEKIALNLVREYLAKKGYKKALKVLHSELKVQPEATTSSIIAKKMGLSKLLSKNKKKKRPLDTLVEVLAEHLYNKHTLAKEGKNSKNAKSDRDTHKSTLKNSFVSLDAEIIPRSAQSQRGPNVCGKDDDREYKKQSSNSNSSSRQNSRRSSNQDNELDIRSKAGVKVEACTGVATTNEMIWI